VKKGNDVPVPTSESFTSASIPRSFINLHVSLAAGMYAFPYNAVRQLSSLPTFVISLLLL